MRNFINKKAKNVKSDRFFRGTFSRKTNKVETEEVKTESIEFDEIVDVTIIPEIGVPSIITEVTIVKPEDEILTEEQPKPMKKKSVNIENKDTKIED